MVLGNSPLSSPSWRNFRIWATVTSMGEIPVLAHQIQKAFQIALCMRSMEDLIEACIVLMTLEEKLSPLRTLHSKEITLEIS